MALRLYYGEAAREYRAALERKQNSRGPFKRLRFRWAMRRIRRTYRG